jgi:dTDP-4-amino-4,6-dideoxygalactose transaminase
MNTKIWLASPHMSGREQKYIQEAFDTNWIAPVGPNIDAFEKELGEYLKISHVTTTNSGTAAIHLALIVLGVKKDDEVMASSFTFSATINPIVYQGATAVLIDCEQDTWNMDPVLLEQAITDRMKKNKKPKAILVAHLYGMPAKMDRILSIARTYDIPVIEDAAEAFGSKYNGIHCGTMGIIGTLSFNGNKIITTSGGGALVSENEEYISRAKFLASQARDESTHYQHSQIGYNYRLSNVLAGIGRGQLEVIEERIAAHRRNNALYCELLSDIPEITFHCEPGETYFSNYWLITMEIRKPTPAFNSELIRVALAADNIESRPLWKPMHLQPVFQTLPAYVNGVSEKLFQTGLCLPSGSNLTDGDIERVVKIIRSVRK